MCIARVPVTGLCVSALKSCVSGGSRARASERRSTQVSPRAARRGHTSVHVWVSVRRRGCTGALQPASACAGLTAAGGAQASQGQAYVAMMWSKVSCSCARSLEVASSPRLSAKVLLPSLSIPWTLRGLNPATHRGGGSGSDFFPSPFLDRSLLLSSQGLRPGKPLSAPRGGEFP